MMRAIQLAVACVAVLVASAGQVQAGLIVEFTGRITSVQSFGTVDAISQYIAVGDTFSGYFEYDPDTSGSSISTINDVGEWRQYNAAVTDFALTFTSGNSAGESINGIASSLSSMTVADDILNSDTGPITDLTSGVLWHPSDQFQPGLRQRNLVYRFWDFEEAALVDSANLADWNADQVFANFDTQSNELAFNSVETNFAQRANFEFTEFSSASATVPEPSSLVLFGIGASVMAFGAARRRRREKQTSAA